MNIPLHLIDAFADAPFTGNPAGVVLLDGPRPDAWLQQVAMEMNQAETAFLLRTGDGWSLRWFTPRAEVDLCGHATMAAAHFLWSEGLAAPGDVLAFATRSGILTAALADGWITLDMPGILSVRVPPPDEIAAALGVRPVEVLKGDFDLLCVVQDAAQVRALDPDQLLIAKWDVRGLIVTAPGDRPGVDFVSRCFFPRLGIPEDPVTGSAHCALAVYWGAILGRTALTGHQASPRGGTLRCELAGSRVRLSGRAVTTLKGTLVA